MMRFRNTWKKFDMQYISNLKNCNGSYTVDVHVQYTDSEKNAYEKAVSSIKKLFPSMICNFSSGEIAVVTYDGYEFEGCVGCTFERKEDAINFIEMIRPMPKYINTDG